MRYILKVGFLLTILFGAVSALANDTYKLKFHDFNELTVVDDINVDYICDPSKAGMVEFDAPKNLVSSIIFEPSKTKLSIKLAASDSVYRELPTIKVYSSYLTSVKNDGDSLVRVLSIADGPKFSCRVIGNGKIIVHDVKTNELNASIFAGNGKITVYGECKVANLKVTGSGTIQAEELKSLEANCTASHGSIYCNAVEKLSVGGVSGNVYYRGTPELKKRFLAHIKLTQLESNK